MGGITRKSVLLPRLNLRHQMTIVPASRPKAWVVIAVTVAALLGGVAPSAHAAEKDLKKEQSDVRKQRAATAARVNALKASVEEVDRALQALSSNVRSQESKVAAARSAAASASDREAILRKEAERAEARVAELRASVKALAVRMYIRPMSAEPILKPRSIADVARGEVLLSAYTRKRSDVLEAYQSARDDLDKQRKAAADAAQEARRRSIATESQLRDLTTAKSQQQKFAASAEARLEGALAEAAALAAIDKNLSAQIVRQQSQLASKLKGSGTNSGRLNTSKVPLTTVRGITVASSIASQVEALLKASDGAGLHLGGSGYRDSSQQVALRRAHCGTSDYDVYEKPASECSPPTARPGYSMHEQGLAIDFTNNGSIISSRSDVAYQWLSLNAKKYGLYNLPSEPWHWSTTGN
jgi:LAS superfamily LD-carboxypeptidase LdcB